VEMPGVEPGSAKAILKMFSKGYGIFSSSLVRKIQKPPSGCRF